MSTTLTSLVLLSLGVMALPASSFSQGTIGPNKLMGSSVVVVDNSRTATALDRAAWKTAPELAARTIFYTYTVELNAPATSTMIVYIDDSSGGLHHPVSITFNTGEQSKNMAIWGMYAPRSGYLTAYNANSTVSLAVATVNP